MMPPALPRGDYSGSSLQMESYSAKEVSGNLATIEINQQNIGSSE
jgi:hypothetical protein